MKSFLVIALLFISQGSHAFAPSSIRLSGTATTVATTAATATGTALNAYVPDGLTADQYNKIKQQEKNKYVGKNLGALGPRGFKSRSMQAWQEAYEKGQVGHEIAPFGYRQQLKDGKLKKADIPYMVRGGSWDNSDLKGVKRRTWLKTDKDYANGGYKKQQSASFLGTGPGFDWTGTRPRDVNMGNQYVPGFFS